MEVSVIISYYKNINNLDLILRALNAQSSSNFEVIISEDDNNIETDEYLKNHTHTFDFPLFHLNQPVDDGFRKNMMLNKSIRASKGKTLVFIDCDCIPHKHFVKEFIKNSQKGLILYGKRLMLGDKISKKILKSKSLGYLHFVTLLFSDSERVKEAYTVLC
ncbi:MAG: glycosyltransferase [Bacteroidales bacterium]|nr:glycosyltransferase [Bacteroidales bacterium]